MVTYWKHGNNVTYSVVCSTGTRTCRYFMKMRYCKHLLHTHAFYRSSFQVQGEHENDEETGMHDQFCR
jgi:hypothetical protein